MRLSFSTNDYLNTVIHDEDGRQLYSISSPELLHSQITITEHGPQGGDDVIGIITWHPFRGPNIWLRATGVEVAGNSLLKPKRSSLVPSVAHSLLRPFSRQRTNCRLTEEGSGDELAKYHKRNLGIMSPSHAPYLEVSPSLSHLLDYVVVTFVYAQKLSQDKKSTAAGPPMLSGAVSAYGILPSSSQCNQKAQLPSKSSATSIVDSVLIAVELEDVQHLPVETGHNSTLHSSAYQCKTDQAFAGCRSGDNQDSGTLCKWVQQQQQQQF
ncbi:hypothetical protein EV401DRAFT_1891585 [Pisolithus croceorrhizus]|nr:hypothetical protein EV401DRAFT_1891585 [Pisolithus croceorrhizus]